MGKGNIGEFTTPLSSYADTTEQRLDLVAKTFPKVKAGVAKFPDTVNAVGTIRFS